LNIVKKNISIIFSLNKDSIQTIDSLKTFYYFQLPPYIGEFDLPIFQQALDSIITKKVKGIFISNLSHFQFFKNNKIQLFADSSLYTLNSFTANFLFRR
jgi:hypothetical protein